MAALDLEGIKVYTKHFFQERSNILMDIEQLLNQVLQFLNQTYSKSGNDRRLTNLDLLFKSLCFVHGFYLYPANGDRETAMNINVKKDAVKDIVTRQFGTVYPHVHKPEFWEDIYMYTTIEELPREPAHLFLEMAHEVLPKKPEIACQIAKKYLEKLPNENRLKPVVWAQVKDDPSLCGVSLGVRHNIRPIFLCVKLLKLKKIVENNVSLSETVALQRTQRDHYGAHAKEYHIKKNPCPSCCIFFDKLNFCNKTRSSLPPFGNCAEYDIIHTSSLNSILNNSETDWKTFYSACEFVFQEFLELINNTIVPQLVQEYVRNMKENSKFLQFKKQVGESYELKVDDWWKFKNPNL